MGKVEVVDWAQLDIARLMMLGAETDSCFVSRHNEDNGAGRIFGGQILGQVLSSIARTVKTDRPVHALQLMFCSSGHPAQPVRYKVESVSDGATTSVRSLHATQADRTLCIATASCRRPGSAFEHNDAQAEVAADPMTDFDVRTLVAQNGEALAGHPLDFIARKSSIEMRLVDAPRYFGASTQLGGARRVSFWVRSPKLLPDDLVVHQCAVAYLTDYVLAHVPQLQVMSYPETGRMLAASVNHSLWFYGPIKADDWLLVEVSCPVAASGRGLATAKVYDDHGRVVAVTSQECVYRPNSV